MENSIRNRGLAKWVLEAAKQNRNKALRFKVTFMVLLLLLLGAGVAYIGILVPKEDPDLGRFISFILCAITFLICVGFTLFTPGFKGMPEHEKKRFRENYKALFNHEDGPELIGEEAREKTAVNDFKSFVRSLRWLFIMFCILFGVLTIENGISYFDPFTSQMNKLFNVNRFIISHQIKRIEEVKEVIKDNKELNEETNEAQDKHHASSTAFCDSCMNITLLSADSTGREKRIDYKLKTSQCESEEPIKSDSRYAINGQKAMNNMSYLFLSINIDTLETSLEKDSVLTAFLIKNRLILSSKVTDSIKKTDSAIRDFFVYKMKSCFRLSQAGTVEKTFSEYKSEYLILRGTIFQDPIFNYQKYWGKKYKDIRISENQKTIRTSFPVNFPGEKDFWKMIFSFIEILINNLCILPFLGCFLALYPFKVYNLKRHNNLNETNWQKDRILICTALGVLLLSFFHLAFVLFFFFQKCDAPQVNTTNDVFFVLSGILNGVIFILLIGRFEDQLMSLKMRIVAPLYIYPALQPLFILFTDPSKQGLIVIIALGLKIYLFIVVLYLVETGRLYTYLYCFIDLDMRANSIYANQFEFRVEKSEHHTEHGDYSVKIYYDDVLLFSSDKHYKEREDCIKAIKRMKDETQKNVLKIAPNRTGDGSENIWPLDSQRNMANYKGIENGADVGSEAVDIWGTHWVEFSADDGFYFSRDYHHEHDVLKLMQDFKQMIPFCKVKYC